MLALATLAATAAVLCGPEIAVVRTDAPGAVRRAPLPGEGIAIFAAPDMRVLVPLRDRDETAVLSPAGTVTTIRGRVFPLFFDEPDRMLAVVPGFLVLASYPERLPLERMPLEGVSGAWRAACSGDGRLAAVIAAGEGRRVLVMAGTRPGTPVVRVPLPAAATCLASSPDGGWVAVGLEGGKLCVAAFGGSEAVSAPVDAGGGVASLAVSGDGRQLVAGIGGAGSGAVVGVSVRAGDEQPLKIRFSTPLPAPVRDLAVAGDGVVAVSGDALAILGRNGRRLERLVPLPGAAGVVVLPERASSTVPEWSDRPGR